MMKDTGFPERLVLIRKTLGFNQKDFAQKLNMSPATLSEVEAGKYRPHHDFFFNLAKECDINLHFLILGEGKMFRDPIEEFGKSTVALSVNKEDMRSFFWYFQRSRIMQYHILGSFRSILGKERGAIQKEVEEYEAAKG